MWTDTSDLYFVIREDGLGGCGLTEQGFCRMWASTRASTGVKGGRYYFEVRVEENMNVEMSETEMHPHAIRFIFFWEHFFLYFLLDLIPIYICLPKWIESFFLRRIGWTTDNSTGLGEDSQSFGYGSTGKKVFNNKFEQYGESYGPGDVIGCFLVRHVSN